MELMEINGNSIKAITRHSISRPHADIPNTPVLCVLRTCLSEDTEKSSFMTFVQLK